VRPVTRKRIALLVVTPVVLVSCVAIYRVAARLLRDPIAPLYAENCAVCHGEDLEGAAQGSPLVGRALVHGESVDEIARSISEGFAATGMPAWSGTLDENQIRGLAILISEKRAVLGRTEFKTDMPLVIPEGVIGSERHAFRIEGVASGLHPLPYSIAPLPDGRILLTEKVRGLSIISPDGKRSALIEGTPPTHDDGMELFSLVRGRGWMLDVALHPDYEKSGWIYLHFGDRCRECDTSMNKLVRGRLADGRWASEEVIWSAAPESYTTMSDMTAGGRICFDGNGHVFLSVGIKGSSDHDGVQDLSLPYGKIHRVHDDGRIPPDNPFVTTPGALPSIWSYGHRSPQGLEFDPRTGRLWSTEMGPRGGDEFNLLRPGKNYGWPLTSKGVNYDGTPVAWGKELGITFDLAEIEQPVVDMTPAPAVSSFVLYRGSAFPGWQNDAIVGTLKATELYRFVIEGERVVHRETLLRSLARIRDVEVGPDGYVYLLLEHETGGRIVRLVPADGS
jgi:glucose/arabinose dehydrogenase